MPVALRADSKASTTSETSVLTSTRAAVFAKSSVKYALTSPAVQEAVRASENATPSIVAVKDVGQL